MADNKKYLSFDGHQHTKSDITDFPTSLPADGGNADTVNGHTINADVPANAKFTDTTYNTMSGASASAAGKSGLVPTPPAGALKTYLSAVGGWANPFAPTVITEVGTDANSYRTSGIYFFLKDQSPLNAPFSGCNGWLLVSTYGSSIAIKQIWFRLGAVGVNDNDTFVRTYVNGTWSDWKQFATFPSVSACFNILSVSQGNITSLTKNGNNYYIPYKTGASMALIELWLHQATVTSTKTTYSTTYGTKLINKISSNMTSVSPTLTMIACNINVGADTTGRLIINTDSSSSSEAIDYRVTWYVEN